MRDGKNQKEEITMLHTFLQLYRSYFPVEKNLVTETFYLHSAMFVVPKTKWQVQKTATSISRRGMPIGLGVQTPS